MNWTGWRSGNGVRRWGCTPAKWCWVRHAGGSVECITVSLVALSGAHLLLLPLFSNSPLPWLQVLEEGALQPVIALLTSTCPESQREAALLLGQFATTDPETKVEPEGLEAGKDTAEGKMGVCEEGHRGGACGMRD